MSPCEIKVLLLIYVSPHILFHNSPAHCEALEKLENLGAIERCAGQLWQLTALGDAWVRALCNVNCPTIAYLDSNGNPL